MSHARSSWPRSARRPRSRRPVARHKTPRDDVRYRVVACPHLPHLPDQTPLVAGPAVEVREAHGSVCAPADADAGPSVAGVRMQGLRLPRPGRRPCGARPAGHANALRRPCSTPAALSGRDSLRRDVRCRRSTRRGPDRGRALGKAPRRARRRRAGRAPARARRRQAVEAPRALLHVLRSRRGFVDAELCTDVSGSGDRGRRAGRRREHCIQEGRLLVAPTRTCTRSRGTLCWRGPRAAL